MEEEYDIRTWCRQSHLTEETFQVLQQEGFTSVQFLRLLTPEEVDKWLKQPRLLPLAQSLALQHAIEQLKSKPDGQEEAMETTSCLVATSQMGFQPTSIQPEASWAEQQQNQHQRYDAHCSAETAAISDARSSYFQEVEAEPYRFLLVGKTGSGKSTTGNSILGAELFDEDVAFDSQTNRSQLKRNIVNGKGIEIMDSPGLFDTGRTHEEISIDIVKAVACMHPGPHAILYVIRLGRYTEEEYEVYKRLKALFDEDVTRYIIVVFTGGDGLAKEGKGIQEVLQKVPTSLNKVLQECHSRVVVFNNVTDDKQPYVQQLLHEVDQLVRINKGGYYACPKYAEVGQDIEEEVARRLDAMEREQLAEKPYVQELKKKVLSAEEELQEERRLFEQREQERQLQAKAAEERSEAEMEALLEEMKKKDYTLEQQQAEKEKLLEKHKREREERKREMDKQREQDEIALEKKQREVQAEVKKAEQLQRRFLEAKRSVYERKISQMKDQIVKDQEPSFLDKCLKKIKGVMDSIVSMFHTKKIMDFFTGSKQ